MGLVDKALEWGCDILILGICLNDTEDWRRPKKLLKWRHEQLPRPASGWIGFLCRHSQVARFVYLKVQTPRMKRAFISYYERIYDPAYTGWEIFTKAITKIKKKCEDQDVTFVGLIFPLLSHDLRRDAYPFTAMHEAIHTVFAEEGIRHLDLLNDFTALSPQRMQAIPGFNPHPSEIAHRIAAESMFRYLHEQDLIAETYYPVRRHTADDEHRVWKRIQKLYEEPFL